MAITLKKLTAKYDSRTTLKREKEFVDKHKIDVIADPSGNGDDVFDASKIKAVDRATNNHGYNPGEDAKVYEDALDSIRETIKAFYDEQDIVLEDSELDELSESILEEIEEALNEESYHIVNRHTGQVVGKAKTKSGAIRVMDKHDNIYGSYAHTIKTIVKEDDQIDELSKEKLGNYIKAAVKSKTDHDYDAAENHFSLERTRDSKERDKIKDNLIRKHDDISWRRKKGIDRAVNKLTKEDDNQIDELCSKTHSSYFDKAATSRGKAEKEGDDKTVAKRDRGLKSVVNKPFNMNEKVEKILNKYLPEDYDSRVERLFKEIDYLPESYIKSLASLYESLDFENRLIFLDYIENDMINELFNFYIENKEYIEPLTEECWKGYKQLGMKKKSNKDVPNCVKEDNLDELSKGYIGNYIKAAKDNLSQHQHVKGWSKAIHNTTGIPGGYHTGDHEDTKIRRDMFNNDREHAERKAKARSAGIDRAVSKLTKEEDNLDELSPNTYKSYLKKAPKSIGRLWKKQDSEEDKAMSTDGEKYPEKQERHRKNAADADRKSQNRHKGMLKVKEKLSEDDNNLNELSDALKARYRNKSYNSTDNAKNAVDHYTHVEPDSKQSDHYKNIIKKRANGIRSSFHKERKGEQEAEAKQTHHAVYDKKTGGYDIVHKKTGKIAVKDAAFSGGHAMSMAANFRESFEDNDNLNELSKEKLGNYLKSASNDLSNRSFSAGVNSTIANRSKNPDVASDAHDNMVKDSDKEAKRKSGIKTAISKLTREDIEYLDELSDQKLGKYIKAASIDMADHANKNGNNTAHRSATNNYTKSALNTIKYHSKKEKNRREGISRAVDKLTKEEVLDELSNDKMNTYTDAAYKNREKTFRSGGSRATIGKREKGIQIASRLLAKKKEASV